MTRFFAECLHCGHEMHSATEAEHHTCEQNTLIDKIDALRAQNAELLAALENLTASVCIDGRIFTPGQHAVERAKTAIAKAKKEKS